MTIFVNAPVGEYGYGLLEDETLNPNAFTSSRAPNKRELRLLANEVLVFVEQAVARQILLGLRESLTIAGQLGRPVEVVNNILISLPGTPAMGVSP